MALTIVMKFFSHHFGLIVDLNPKDYSSKPFGIATRILQSYSTWRFHYPKNCTHGRLNYKETEPTLLLQFFS